MCGACLGCAWGVRVGRGGVCEMCGVRGVCLCGVRVGGAWDVRGVGAGRKERVSLARLYYPDTMVNPDTCLGYNIASEASNVYYQN